ncbi:hypothetical protein DC094_18185 [Pelagibaculum spongiae]|uniref:Uncharacterized protein n=2 Tax=Pelagibaculum spongiae TaxID=2080658 RepID=A0A2V1GRK9_9GAMM|nr:hypothetical protein DC094_18185 [Pelagibaculum spongiae]
MFNPWMAFLPNFLSNSVPNFMPQIHFPFSGAVNQNIAPEMDWFFSTIPSAAGNGPLEKKIFEQHSYGTQLDKLSEAVLAIAEHVKAESLDEVQTLLKLSIEIDQLKELAAEDLQKNLMQSIDSMKQSNPELLKQVLTKHI